MEALIAPYPVGKAVRVYYDPQAPERAVPNPRAPSDWMFWLFVGIAFCALAAYLAMR